MMIIFWIMSSKKILGINTRSAIASKDLLQSTIAPQIKPACNTQKWTKWTHTDKSGNNRRKVNNTATQSKYFQTTECTQVSGVSIIAIGIVESKLTNTSPWSSVIRLVFVLRASALRIPLRLIFLQQFHPLLQDVIFWYDTISIIISVIFLDGTVLNVWWMIYGWGRGKAPLCQLSLS